MKINKTAFFLFKLVVSALSLYIVFSEAGPRQILSMMRRIGPLYFFTACLIYIAAQAISTFRWKLLLPENFTFRKLFSLYMIGAFFNSFLPGLVGGDVVKAYYLNKDARKLGVTLASIFMDRYVGYVALMIVGMVSYPFALRYFGASVYKWVMPAIVCAFIVGSFLFFGLRLGRRFTTMSEFYEYFVLLKSRKVVIAKAVLMSLCVQIMGFSAVALLASAMGEDIPIFLLFVFLPIIITVTTVPISISGLGVREGAFVLLLGLIGIRPELATSLSLSWFFSSFLGSLPGLAAYIKQTGGARR
ncbi:MAG: lysylphosphatidylglycerol synthase transmembrane domain-containing protein [Nitrospiraceae bacterium]|nr:lysylphosphatidylglycerol synthase transmembrane domain-containing protein [Nitrospiraceae bacterium]